MKENIKLLLNFTLFKCIWNAIKLFAVVLRKGYTLTLACVNFMYWCLFCKNKITSELKKCYSIRNTSTYKFYRWKHGVAYLIGKLNGREVFIKTSGKLGKPIREIYALRYIRDNCMILRNFIPRIHVMECCEDYVVEDYIEGLSLSCCKKLDTDSKKKIVEQLLIIYTELKRNNILHLDIRPDNFIVTEKLDVYLIDFGYALINSTDVYSFLEMNNNTYNIIRNLGSNFALGEGKLDDAYSMLLTIKSVYPDFMKDFKDKWYMINCDIGKRTIDIVPLKTNELIKN